mgnify:CR=1 FL=1
MEKVEERFLVYTALMVLCATMGTFLGLAVGLLSFIQVAAIIELVYWFAIRTLGGSARGW